MFGKTWSTPNDGEQQEADDVNNHPPRKVRSRRKEDNKIKKVVVAIPCKLRNHVFEMVEM